MKRNTLIDGSGISFPKFYVSTTNGKFWYSVHPDTFFGALKSLQQRSLTFPIRVELSDLAITIRPKR